MVPFTRFSSEGSIQKRAIPDDDCAYLWTLFAWLTLATLSQVDCKAHPAYLRICQWMSTNPHSVLHRNSARDFRTMITRAEKWCRIST